MHVNHIRANGWNEKTIAVLWKAVLPKHFKRQHFTQVQTLIQWCTGEARRTEPHCVLFIWIEHICAEHHTLFQL